MTRTPGKARGLTRISDGQGRFAALAIDQRPPLFDLAIRKLSLPAAEVGPHASALKGLLAETLAAHASGLLVDPYYGYCRALPHVPGHTGLLLTLEHHAFETDARGFRRSGLIPDWDAERAVRYGADALKLLAWYRPDAPRAVRAHQHDFVARAGEACRRVDRPFVFEVLPYPLPDEDESAYAAALPELMRRCALDFADPAYGVDLYKLGFPGPAAGVREWGGAQHALAKLEAVMAETGARLPAPWVLLSGGMDAPRFLKAFDAALRAGARGYLAGRAVWWEAVQAYPDVSACRAALEGEAVDVLGRLNAALAALPPLTFEFDCDLERHGTVELQPGTDY